MHRSILLGLLLASCARTEERPPPHHPFPPSSVPTQDAGGPTAGPTPPPGMVDTLPETTGEIAAEHALDLRAKDVARGMTKVSGGRYVSTLKPGQRGSMMITLEPGTCYSILGATAPEVGTSAVVTDLRLTLFGPPSYALVAGRSDTGGPFPVLGPDPNPTCPLLPFAVPYKLEVHASGGSGPVAVQVYRRPAK